MWLGRLVSVLVLVACGCVPSVRTVTLEAPVDTGVAVPFGAEQPRRWDFGDGSPPQEGALVRHAFTRAGTYVVRGFEGDAVRDTVQVVAVPRSAFHATPPDVQAAVVARTVDELGPAIDFLERLASPRAVQRRLDEWPALGFAVDQGTFGAQVVDRAEGAGVFIWPDSDGVVSFVGVQDDEVAEKAFGAWLTERGWREREVGRYESAEAEAVVFAARGVLYAVVMPAGVDGASVRGRIAQADPRGLELDGAMAAAIDALPSGGLALLVRPNLKDGAAWTLLAASLKFQALEATLAGRIYSGAPLWVAPSTPDKRLLASAPQGVVAAAAFSIPGSRLGTLLLGDEGSPRWQRAAEAARRSGGLLGPALSAVSGQVDAALYFDAEAFLRSASSGQGRPEPRGTLLLQASVTSAEPLAPLCDAMMDEVGPRLLRGQDGDTRVWRSQQLGHLVELVLSAKALFLRVGDPPSERPVVDLSASLARRFGGAFAPGHVSVFLDLGQLRRELLVPRFIEGTDPRNVIAAQALSLTFLDRLTQLDQIVLDAAPAPSGAEIQATVRLRPPPEGEARKPPRRR